jgi:hypothetical protein
VNVGDAAPRPTIGILAQANAAAIRSRNSSISHQASAEHLRCRLKREHEAFPCRFAGGALRIGIESFNKETENFLPCRFHRARGGHERSGESGKDRLLTRLMYLAESTSTAVRLNATWSLSLPAMSLLRDRYEQVVRFSWLARQTDSTELTAFIDTYYAKAAKVFGNISPMQWAHLAGELDVQKELQVPLTKEERTHLARWEDLDLRSMARIGAGEIIAREARALRGSQHRIGLGVSPQGTAGEREIGPGRKRDGGGRQRKAFVTQLEQHRQDESAA